MQVKMLGRSVSAVITLVLIAAAAFAQAPRSQRVVLVIDENSSFSEVTANMPWLVAQGKAYGYAANYESDNGGSLFDYLWLASGSCHSSANCTLPPGTHDFHCTGNDCFVPRTTTTDPITDDNIFRALNNAGISWKVYAQSYVQAGGSVTTPDNNNGTAYYRRHNGATWYSDILSNVAGSAGKIVDLSELSSDLASGSLPRFMIIVPDGNHDAHDCPVGLSTCTEAEKLTAADEFLKSTVGPVLATPDFHSGGSGLFIVTFDECGGGTDSGCGAAVYTALIGPQIIPHTVSNVPYKHENTLRTMLDSLGISTYPGASATAADMSDFFESSAMKPQVKLSSPSNGASLNSPVSLQASALVPTDRAISGWKVYVDNVAVYSAGSNAAISTSLKMNAGAHAIVVRAWDDSGAYGDQAFAIKIKTAVPVIAVTTPLSGSTVTSPVAIQASASPTAGHSVSGWWVYVDGIGVYSAGSVAAIGPAISMSPGVHTVVVRAWDTSGAYGDQVLKLTADAKPAVTLSEPSTKSTKSPISIQASAVASKGKSIEGWCVYLDNALAYQGGAVNSINTSVSAAAGPHTLVVRAWDSSGAYGDQTVSVDLKAAVAVVKMPATKGR